MKKLHRRSLAAAGALLVGLGGTVRAADHDGDLILLVGEFVAHEADERARVAAMTPEERDAHHNARFKARYVDGQHSRSEVLARAIARIPARTPEGMQAKARALLWQHGGTDAGPLLAIGDGLWESLLADMTGTPCRFPSASRPSAPGGAS